MAALIGNSAHILTFSFYILSNRTRKKEMENSTRIQASDVPNKRDHPFLYLTINRE